MKDEDFFRCSSDIDKARELHEKDELSIGDRIVLLQHNQTLLWDKLLQMEKKKCCKD